MKTIFISRHGVLIIMIVTSNMSCINLLTSTHNLSMDRKIGIHPHARLKSLLHLIWNLEWHLWIMRIVKAPFNSRKFSTLSKIQNENFQCILIFSFHFQKIRFVLEFG